MQKKSLVTGIGSGLGAYLHKNLYSDGLNRMNLNDISGNYYDTIVHCAFNRRRNPDLYQYMEDNLFLTKHLLENVKYNRFIYISSIDIYNPEQTLYSSFKWYAEAIVSNFPNTIIIRLPVLLGEGMKPNHLTRIMNEESPELTLSPYSTFNYVLYEDVLKLIQREDVDNLLGTLDFISENNITLRAVADVLGKEVQFGDFEYNTPIYFDNPVYTGKTSLETIKEFIR